MSGTGMIRAPATGTACDPATRVTKSLLGYGVLAGPSYVVVVVAQALFRPGFNIMRDDASLLSNGSFGWIQVANFLVTGLMVIACAVGMGQALRGTREAIWGPRLLSVYGVGLIAAGIFVADPMNGFPPGTPAGRPEVMSVHGTLHIAAAGIGFLCFVAACFVLARHFASLGDRVWAGISRATAVVFFAGFLGLASGSGSPVIVLGFWAALLVAWGWIAALAVHLYRRVAAANPAASA